jgi:hypothetical protein
MSNNQVLVHPRPLPAPLNDQTALDCLTERPLLRLGAAAMVVGLVGGIAVNFLHGGSDAGNLQAVLPDYAANNQWELVHLAQFLCDILVLVGFIALYRSLTTGAAGLSATLARLGMVVAVVAESIYGVNQAVDGVATKFVAQQWVNAAPADKAEAFRIADTVRHIEIGTSSVWVLSVALFLILFGLAIALGHTYPRLLGWAAVAVGLGEVAYAVDLAVNGFNAVSLALVISLATGLWTLTLAVFLWRRAGPAGHRL